MFGTPFDQVAGVVIRVVRAGPLVRRGLGRVLLDEASLRVIIPATPKVFINSRISKDAPQASRQEALGGWCITSAIAVDLPDDLIAAAGLRRKGVLAHPRESIFLFISLWILMLFCLFCKVRQERKDQQRNECHICHYKSLKTSVIRK